MGVVLFFIYWKYNFFYSKEDQCPTPESLIFYKGVLINEWLTSLLGIELNDKIDTVIYVNTKNLVMNFIIFFSVDL